MTRRDLLHDPSVTFDRPEGLDPEPEVVWLEDPTRYEYLRQVDYRTTLPRKRPRVPLDGGRLIGYDRHERMGRGLRGYTRRFWWLKPHDQPYDPTSPYGNGHYPAEAVRITNTDPLVIRSPRTGDIVTDE